MKQEGPKVDTCDPGRWRNRSTFVAEPNQLYSKNKKPLSYTFVLCFKFSLIG